MTMTTMMNESRARRWATRCRASASGGLAQIRRALRRLHQENRAQFRACQLTPLSVDSARIVQRQTKLEGSSTLRSARR
jgi:hypothetical protein